ncbi:hypothetical protein [Pyrobaculum sp.]|uniref:hypothetical protein n=1 Tax=Pyrobaculum sp. TaxID=2004705 RepID=UPI00316B7E82
MLSARPKPTLTEATERWIAEMAKELGVKPKAFRKAVLKLARHGVWLEAEDWRLIARALDLSKYLNMAVDYVIRRVASGVSVAQAVRELPVTVEKAGKLAHIREVLSNLV